MTKLTNIQNVIFDLDGTLLNTLQDLTDSVNYVMIKYQSPTFTTNQVRQMVGNGIRKLIERALPNGEDNRNFEAAFADFKLYYQEHCKNKTQLYPGIADLISELRKKQIRIGVVSNKNHEALVKLCDYFFAGEVDVVIGQKDGVPKKPAPDAVINAMAQLQATKENTIYIGDSEVDAQTAWNAKLPGILVTWGFRDKEVLSECQFYAMIDHPIELFNYI